MGVASELARLKVGAATDFAQAEDGLKGFSEKLGGLAGKAAISMLAVGGAVVASAAVMVGGFVEAGKEAKHFADTFGMAPHVASQWIQSAALMNVSQETLQTGFSALTRVIGNMDLQLDATGKVGKLQTEIFKEMKIKIYDTHGALKPMPSILAQVADRIAAMKDGTEKAILVQKLFGKSAGPELIPFLNQGSAGIQALMGQADKLGATLSNEDVEATHKYELGLARLHVEVTGISNTFARIFLPVAADIAGVINTRVMPAVLAFSRWFAQDAKPKIDEFVGQVTGFLKPKVIEFVDWIKAHWPEIKTVISTTFEDVKKVLKDVTTDVGDLGGAIRGLQGNSNALQTTMTPLIGSLKFLHEHTQLVARAVEIATVAYVGYMVIQGIIAVVNAVHSAWLTILAVKTWVVTAAQWAWNFAMSANPIGLVIIGIALLVGAIVWLVLHWQQVVTWAKLAWAILSNVPVIGPAIQGIVASIGTVVDIVSGLWQGFTDLIGVIGDVIGWLGRIKLPGPLQDIANVIGAVGHVAGSGVGIGRAQRHAVGGRAAYTGLHILERGELVLNSAQEQAVNRGALAGAMAAPSVGSHTTVLPVAFVTLPPSREQVAVMNESLRRYNLEQRKGDGT